MPLLLLSLFLLLVVGLLHLRQLARANLGPASGPSRIRLLILVQDQEPWVEEFIRKLFRGLQCVPQSEVLVFDSGSRDSTVAILELLSRHYPLGILTAGDVGISPAVKAGCISKEVNGCCYADLRKLQGKDLFRAASFLARLN